MMYEKFDDLSIVTNAHLRDCGGLTAMVLVRDEMYFLPAFLQHYRRLGVERFIVLNDRSEDGSQDYLAAQPDVMVVASRHRFGTRLYPETTDGALKDVRIAHVWRTLLMRTYARDRWALLLDADEFLALPDGLDMPGLVAMAEKMGTRGVLGVMLDMYPEGLAGLETDEAHLDPAAAWYFDGRPHVRPAAEGPPLRLYHGARARLYSHFVERDSALRREVRRWKTGHAYRKQGSLHKVPVVKWQAKASYMTAHWPDLPVTDRILLPIQHFKFTPDLHRRTAAAIASGEYSNGSRFYHATAAILDGMRKRNAGFLTGCSTRGDAFEAFQRTGNALLP